MQARGTVTITVKQNGTALEKQTFRKISGVDRNHERLSAGVLQNQVRTGLSGLAIPLPQKKTNELASGNHSIQGKRDRLGVDSASCWNGLAFFTAVLDVKAHGLQDAFLGLLDGLPEAIDAWKIFAVGVVTLALSFDCYGIAVKRHPAPSLP